MMRKLMMLVALMWGMAAVAVNPIRHDQILKENPQSMSAVGDDEENPYLILIGEAEKAIDDGDYVSAIMRFKDAMRVEPDNPSNVLLYNNLGLLYSQLGQDSLAMKAYDNALAIAPSMTTVLSNRAQLCLRLGRDAEAMRGFADVIDRDSLNVKARFYHGMMSLYAGDAQSAIADFGVLKMADPDSENTCLALSSLYSMTGCEAQAIPYYQKLIAMGPEPEYYAGLAGCYLALDRLSDATAAINEGLEKCGDDPELYYYRAWTNKEAYQLDQAKADAKRAIQLGADPRKVMSLFE